MRGARSVVGVAVGGLAALCTTSHAAIIQYSSRAAFDLAAGPTLLQDFESFIPASNAFHGVSFDFGDFAAFNDANSAGGGHIAAPGVINGSAEILGVVTLAGAQFRLTFDFPIVALGFDTFNLADQRFDDLVFNNSTLDVVSVHDPIDQTRFWGFVSDTPFTTITIRQTGFGAGGGDTDGFRIDNVAYTPAPSGAVALLGAAAVASLRRRRT